jgi:ribonuclease HI
VHVYTDGTGGNGEQQPAFAIAIIKTDERDRQTFGGLFCHRPSGVEDPWLAAADCNGVPQNETAAIIATLAWVIQSRMPEGTIIEIVPDAKYAIGNAKAEYSPKSNKNQIKIWHAMMDIASARFEIELHHIKSHRGHPWNCLADVICGACGAEHVWDGTPAMEPMDPPTASNRMCIE